jgi:hypothetical protein
MTYAVASRPTPIPRLLSPEQYDSTGTDLQEVKNAATRARAHYFSEDTVSRRAEMLERTFRHLADDWIADTQFQSSLTRITSHPSYQKIVSFDEEVLPLIFREIAASPRYWFSALRDITGADPVKPHERGDVTAMTAAWLRWAQDHNIRW